LAFVFVVVVSEAGLQLRTIVTFSSSAMLHPRPLATQIEHDCDNEKRVAVAPLTTSPSGANVCHSRLPEPWRRQVS
jgi:hypothetical protein